MSFVIERSALSIDEEENFADVDDVPRMSKRGSSEEAKGNSAILSILGALTETSGESKLRSKPTFALYGVAKAAVLVGNGRDTLREEYDDLLAGVCDIGTCTY